MVLVRGGVVEGEPPSRRRGTRCGIAGSPRRRRCPPRPSGHVAERAAPAVISCSTGWVCEAWWSTVPSVRSLTRLDGTGMGSVSPAAGPPASRGGQPECPRLPRFRVHSSVVSVTREENSMPGPRAVPVRMTIKREWKLRQITGAGTSSQRLVLRARIVMAAADGDPNAKIARDLGCSERTVRQWRGRFAERSIPGIFDRPRPGRPEMHLPSARLAIVAAATSVPPGGEPCWSHALLASELRRRGLDVSAAPVGRVLPRRTFARTRSGAGSTGPTTPPSGRRPARSAACTWPAAWQRPDQRRRENRHPGENPDPPGRPPPGPAATPAASSSTKGTAPSRSPPR